MTTLITRLSVQPNQIKYQSRKIDRRRLLKGHSIREKRERKQHKKEVKAAKSQKRAEKIKKKDKKKAIKKGSGKK